MQNSSATIRMNPSDYEKTNLGQDHHSRGQSSATTHQAMKMLVLGASGGVGKHLVRLACDQGHIVTALVRRELLILDVDPRSPERRANAV